MLQAKKQREPDSEGFTWLQRLEDPAVGFKSREYLYLRVGNDPTLTNAIAMAKLLRNSDGSLKNNYMNWDSAHLGDPKTLGMPKPLPHVSYFGWTSSYVCM